MKYPSGFTPPINGITNLSKSMDDKEESICSSHFKKAEIPRTGGSILQLMEEVVKVGQVIGYNMEGCSKTIEEIIGGILCVWDPRMFHKLNHTISDYFIMIRGKWIPNGKALLIISVYAPQELSEKKSLWEYMIMVIGNWNGEVIIMGDFNEVRNQAKRYGSIFNALGASVFNSFILDAGLEEVPLGGCAFTWCHKSATKMSKLDRFLISEGLMSSCPDISAVTLDRYLSDHRPILLRESYFDYGPTPFRFFHYWFDLEGFNTFVEQTWNEANINDSNAMSRLLKKLRYVKEKIRVWIKVKKDSSSNYRKSLKADLVEIDILLDKGEGNPDILNKRTLVSKALQDINKLESMEMAQKAKIKWAMRTQNTIMAF
ncbi:RNA-directed DNA polymerase, eukaryota [Tanacetum coccineum]